LVVVVVVVLVLASSGGAGFAFCEEGGEEGGDSVGVLDIGGWLGSKPVASISSLVLSSILSEANGGLGCRGESSILSDAISCGCDSVGTTG